MMNLNLLWWKTFSFSFSRRIPASSLRMSVTHDLPCHDVVADRGLPRNAAHDNLHTVDIVNRGLSSCYHQSAWTRACAERRDDVVAFEEIDRDHQVIVTEDDQKSLGCVVSQRFASASAVAEKSTNDKVPTNCDINMPPVITGALGACVF